jgi:hypothetical protein
MREGTEKLREENRKMREGTEKLREALRKLMKLYPKTMSNETAMFEFKTTQDFLDRLSSVSSAAGMSKPEAIVAGIELLEKLVEADRRGMEISFVPRSSDQDV